MRSEITSYPIYILEQDMLVLRRCFDYEMGITRCNDTNACNELSCLVYDDADVTVMSRVNWLACGHLQIQPQSYTRGSPKHIYIACIRMRLCVRSFIDKIQFI